MLDVLSMGLEWLRLFCFFLCNMVNHPESRCGEDVYFPMGETMSRVHCTCRSSTALGSGNPPRSGACL